MVAQKWTNELSCQQQIHNVKQVYQLLDSTASTSASYVPSYPCSYIHAIPILALTFPRCNRQTDGHQADAIRFPLTWPVLIQFAV